MFDIGFVEFFLFEDFVFDAYVVSELLGVAVVVQVTKFLAETVYC